MVAIKDSPIRANVYAIIQYSWRKVFNILAFNILSGSFLLFFGSYNFWFPFLTQGNWCDGNGDDDDDDVGDVADEKRVEKTCRTLQESIKWCNVKSQARFVCIGCSTKFLGIGRTKRNIFQHHYYLNNGNSDMVV